MPARRRLFKPAPGQRLYCHIELNRVGPGRGPAGHLNILAKADVNRLYRDHASTVYNLCLHYTLNRHGAEDLTPEIFVRVHQYHGRYDPARASLSTWIIRIAINHCIDFLKAAKRRRFMRGLFGVGQLIGAIPLFGRPGTQAENRQAPDSLLRVIGQLPPNQKTVVILLKIEIFRSHRSRTSSAPVRKQ